MKRLTILVLDRNNGVITGEYVDSQSLTNFLLRTGRAHKLQLSIHINGTDKALFIEKIDVANLQKVILEFQNKS